MAVAFWGKGAAEQLGLDRRPSGRPITIICNLAMGGTNPDEVRHLRKLENITVLQSSKLHGKVYSFPNVVLIGSANASANGLGFEGSEISGWHEACLVTGSNDVLLDVADWLGKLEAKPISDGELRHADVIWAEKQKRRHGDVISDLIKHIKTNPALLKGRRVYLVAYSEDRLSPQGAKAADKAKDDYGPSVDWYEDWAALPLDATLLSFLIKASGKIDRVDNVLYRLPEPCSRPTGKGKERLELCFKKAGKTALSRQRAQWQKVLTWLVTTSTVFPEKEGWSRKDGSGFLDLEYVARAVEAGELRL